MAGLLRVHQAEGLDRMCDSLTQALLPDDQQRADDDALLVARVRATAPDAVATWSLPEDPRAAALLAGMCATSSPPGGWRN